MISFQPIPAPQCLTDLAAADPIPGFDVPAAHHCLKGVLRPLLLSNQGFQCAYCEAPIEDDGGSCHLAHITSQKENQNRRFDVTNLMAACQSQDTCGHGHGEASVPGELNPYLVTKLHRHFHCAGDGTLTACGLSTEAEDFAFGTVSLNAPGPNTRPLAVYLNAPGLKSQRQGIIRRLMSQTISLGTNARQNLRNLSTRDRGFRSLHYQFLSEHGFPEP
jgi:hypothetical protein